MNAQDTVTVPKSRLEELERKERELERLKQESAKSSAGPAATQSQSGLPAVVQPTTTQSPPASSRPVPPLASLAPLSPGEIIESLDLASHYHTDPSAADRRYRGQHLSIRGEIVGFEKPMLRRNYRILLQSPERETRVICDIYPPEKFSAVFTVNHGSQMVGVIGETRIPIAKVGDKVLVTGQCKGLRESAVMVSGAELKAAQ